MRMLPVRVSVSPSQVHACLAEGGGGGCPRPVALPPAGAVRRPGAGLCVRVARAAGGLQGGGHLPALQHRLLGGGGGGEREQGVCARACVCVCVCRHAHASDPNLHLVGAERAAPKGSPDGARCSIVVPPPPPPPAAPTTLHPAGNFPPPHTCAQGSTGFREAVQQNLRWFEGTRLVVISNTLWVGERLPCITYGMRGMIRWGLHGARHLGGGGGTPHLTDDPFQYVGARCKLARRQCSLILWP